MATISLDLLVRDKARQIHAEHTDVGRAWSGGYKEATLRGAYDGDPELIALRAAVRAGIEMGRDA